MFFFLVKSVLLTLRHDLVLFYWVLSLNEVDFDDLEVYFIFSVHFLQWGRSLDPEARVYFLQCASFDGVSLIDPEA